MPTVHDLAFVRSGDKGDVSNVVVLARHAEVTDLGPDAPLPPSAFEFVFPTGTTMLY